MKILLAVKEHNTRNIGSKARFMKIYAKGIRQRKLAYVFPSSGQGPNGAGTTS